MNTTFKLLKLFFLKLCFYILDPGTGSMLVQAIIAGILGFIMFFKQVKVRIISFFKKNKDKGTQNDIEKDNSSFRRFKWIYF